MDKLETRAKIFAEQVGHAPTGRYTELAAKGYDLASLDNGEKAPSPKLQKDIRDAFRKEFELLGMSRPEFIESSLTGKKLNYGEALAQKNISGEGLSPEMLNHKIDTMNYKALITGQGRGALWAARYGQFADEPYNFQKSKEACHNVLASPDGNIKILYTDSDKPGVVGIVIRAHSRPELIRNMNRLLTPGHHVQDERAASASR